MTSEDDHGYMLRALELAQRGEGHVEPNPMVGCVVVLHDRIVGEGWHARFGGPHAEVGALQQAAGQAAGATLYATLEPCCHHGKTPPCTELICSAGLRRVVVAQTDPFPQVGGQGIARLRAGGIRVEVGLLEDAARRLNAPYLKLIQRQRPWVIAKWAMTLDGKIATRGGDSRWISNESSRRRVHQLRGRVDAVMVGSGTARHDNPLLTARPPGPRRASRVVVDSGATLAPDSRLVQTAHQVPLLVAVGPDAPPARIQELALAGCEVWRSASRDPAERLAELLDELGRRRLTNLLVEGGGGLLGGLFDLREIDEVHAFIAPQLVGGAQATVPLAGLGRPHMAAAVRLDAPQIERLGDDVYVHGRLVR